MSGRSRRLAAVLALLLAPGTSAAAGEDAPGPRATMHQIFEALAAVLPASLDPERFRHPGEREAIEAQLRVLAGSAGALQSHARTRDAGFQYLSRSLARDVREARRRFERGEVEESRYYLWELTQNCVACHSRLPSARQFPMAQRLLDRVEVAELPPRERAQLQVATRRFESALATFESILADPAVNPVEMDVEGLFVDYLTVAIRVERDLPRARRALEGLARRSDLPRYLRGHVEIWIAALRELAPLVAAEPSLARTRELMERSGGLSEFPAGRERFVHDLVASSLLHRLVDAGPPGEGSLAEAYYWLGVIEARSADSYWVPQTELHLEAAIRTDPDGPLADRAYVLLEEYTLLGYGGSAGTHLPPDVQRTLDELRELVDTGSPRPAEADPGDV